jgi:hypothetical protein
LRPESSMVRRGSTVRVRQRALQKRRKSALFLQDEFARAPVCSGYGAVYGAFRLRAALGTAAMVVQSRGCDPFGPAHPTGCHSTAGYPWEGAERQQLRDTLRPAPVSARADDVGLAERSAGRIRNCRRREPAYAAQHTARCGRRRSRLAVAGAARGAVRESERQQRVGVRKVDQAA